MNAFDDCLLAFDEFIVYLNDPVAAMNRHHRTDYAVPLSFGLADAVNHLSIDTPLYPTYPLRKLHDLLDEGCRGLLLPHGDHAATLCILFAAKQEIIDKY